MSVRQQDIEQSGSVLVPVTMLTSMSMPPLILRRSWLLVAVIVAYCLLPPQAVHAEKIRDVAGTRHNLSVTGNGDVRTTATDEVCVFCHTPHASTVAPGAPLWNRALGTDTYTPYTSSSLDAETITGQIDQPDGTSRLCLSCHDGTLAIGSLNILGGQLGVDLPMTGTAADGTMPPGQGSNTGFTRDLGTDLRNDHPVSFVYNTALANQDGELRDPASTAHIGVRGGGNHPPIPLENVGGGGPRVQCASCHDPHIHDTDPSAITKFLRLNRLQTAPPGGGFDTDTDMVCLGCHDKAGWSTSAHASPSVADERYTTAGAALREFPAALPVWQAGCLNCHDTHTVHGSRRLLREGTDSSSTPKSGGESAIEETCYQCHSPNPVITNAGSQVPDIQTEFNRARHMPIDATDQLAATEVHDIVNANFNEPQSLLGKGALFNRHVECTDCHNPHRVIRNRKFNASGNTVAGTHEPGGPDGNVASGVLSGAIGVEPLYGGSQFLDLPVNYQVKQGAAPPGGSDDASSGYVTREYQVCLRCHSDYGYNDNGSYPTGNRPGLGESGGTTPAGTNGLQQYTNQAMEFQAPFGDRGEGNGEHRSWHPVMASTGRTPGQRQADASAWLPPWSGSVGNQTMYCTDCHGGNTANNSIVPPGGENGDPWGPHGSSNDFILKGTWNGQTGGDSREVPSTDPDNGLCFKCHDYQTYADRNGDDRNDSGFSGSKSNNLHAHHADKIESMHCSWCHAAVPHGWKNKALLVNLNDVGPEAGQPSGTEVDILSAGQTYNQGPYYQNAKLKVITFATSGNWEDSNCGSASGQEGSGRDWMRNVCENPP